MLGSQLDAPALVESEHLLLVILFEVVNDEVSTVRDVFLLTAQSQRVVHNES